MTFQLVDWFKTAIFQKCGITDSIRTSATEENQCCFLNYVILFLVVLSIHQKGGNQRKAGLEHFWRHYIFRTVWYPQFACLNDGFFLLVLTTHTKKLHRLELTSIVASMYVPFTGFVYLKQLFQRKLKINLISHE